MLEHAHAGKLIAGRYRLEHQVGEGGMATVWVAEDEKLERWVALKLLGRNYLSSRSVRERFEREAMAIAKLRSPHVVQVYDHGRDTDEEGREVVYIAMELLSGQDLYSWLKGNRPVPLRQIARIIGEVARGLAAAHRAGIVHRDLKPANIFVVRDHDEQTVKVFDFGLARGFRDHSQLRELQDRTGEGVLLGTPRYMSPEQAHGARRVDHRADVWSLGVITYLAVTGRLPFEGTGVGEVVTKIATEIPTPPSELMSGVDAAMDHFFERALAKDPADRFQSAADLALAFDAVVDDNGRTSSDLIGAAEGDTEVELSRADTHSDAPTSAESPTLIYRRGPDDAEATHVDATIVSRRRGSSNTLAAALTLAAAVAVLAASYKFEQRSQTSSAVRVRAPQTPLTTRATPSAPAAERVPSAPSASGAATVNGRAPMGLPAAVPSAAASSPASERGLELFDDRH